MQSNIIKLNKHLTGKNKMIHEARKDSVLCYFQVFRWITLFKNGWEKIEDGPK